MRQNGEGNFRTIQAAANAARPGDTVLIYGGTYRETVTVPPKATAEATPITFAAAPGQHPVISGSEVQVGWQDHGGGVWQLVKPNAYFGSFNPFAVEWPQTDLSNSQQPRTSGGVFIGKTMLFEQASLTTVHTMANTWTSEVSPSTTTIWANFAGRNPNHGSAEITKREMDFTAAWNQAYIRVEGLEITRATAPQDVNYWRPTALPVDGALSTNGGYRWVIRDDVFTQNSGVALDFGMGSQSVVNDHGGVLPSHFGGHQIDDNLFMQNGTDGAFAWKAPYVTVSGNRFVDDNLFNIQLGSEAYFKVVDEGPGVILTHNYFFSDQKSFTTAIWLDSEVQDSRVSQNVLVNTGGVIYEADLANNLFDNNILLNHFDPSASDFGQPSGGITVVEASGVHVVDNLLVGQGMVQISDHYVQNISGGVENDDGVARRMNIYEPGTLTSLGLQRVRIHQNLFSNNIFYGHGMSRVAFTQPPNYDEAALESGNLTNYLANRFWANRVDFNVYFDGARKVNDYDPSLRPDSHSATVPGEHGVTYRCSPSRCVIALQIDPRNSPERLGAPAITSSYIGKSELIPGDRPSGVITDFFGDRRSSTSVTVGPFARTYAGTHLLRIWP